MKLIEHLPFSTDGGIAQRASIGLIVLASDYTIEYEWRQLFSQLPGVALFHSRILNDDDVTPETLRAMEPRLTECARSFTPATAINVVAYGCTSASTAIGEEKVFENIHKAKPEALCTTPITAAFAAFNAFAAKRIAVLTPYSSKVNKIVAQYINAHGFDVPVFGSFNEQQDSVVAKITPTAIEDGVREIIKHAEVDMVFVSCTSVRLMGVCDELEKKLDIPLTSSNHAMAWHALRLAGVDDKLQGFGQLFLKF